MSNAHPPVDPSVDDQIDPDSASDPTAIPAAATTNAPYEYRCPICGTEYNNELIARIHITRAEDSDHAHHNGLMPETDITVVDESGSDVGSVARHPDDLDPTAVSIDDFPPEISEPNRHVLTVAAHHPQETTRTAITDYVRSRLDGSEVDAPAYRTVCSLLNRFYRPHVGGPGADEDETLEDLEPKQQAISIARIVDPDASLSAIAKMVGTANSYPSQVLERASHVLERLEAKEDEHDDSVRAIRSELPDASIVTLREQGLIDDVPISFDIPSDIDGNQTEASSHSNETQDDTWGSPVDQHDVMTATPDSQLATRDATDAATTESSTATEQVDLTGDTTDQSEPATTDTVDTDATESVLLQEGELVELQENINFLQKALDRIAEPTTETDLLAAVLEQVDQQLQQLKKES